MSTKIHLAADLRCRPIARVISAGQRHDSLAFTAVMAQIRIARCRAGRPRTRPDRVLADKAYSTRKIRTSLRGRAIKATIPEPSNQIAGRLARGSAGGRPPKFDADKYKDRNTVERAINRLRGYRAVATRYDKRDSSTAAPSTSPASESGSETPSRVIHRTRPNSLLGTEPFMVSELVLSAFVRIVTNHRFSNPPTTPDDAFGFCEQVRTARASTIVNPGPRHWDIFADLCRVTQARGNVVPDAYLAALAIKNGATFVTSDRGFARFPNLRIRPALAG